MSTLKLLWLSNFPIYLHNTYVHTQRKKFRSSTMFTEPLKRTSLKTFYSNHLSGGMALQTVLLSLLAVLFRAPQTCDGSRCACTFEWLLFHVFLSFYLTELVDADGPHFNFQRNHEAKRRDCSVSLQLFFNVVYVVFGDTIQRRTSRLLLHCGLFCVLRTSFSL